MKAPSWLIITILIGAELLFKCYRSQTVAGEWGVWVRNGKGVEMGGQLVCGSVGDLEFSGMRKENVLSQAFLNHVATGNPETRPLQVFPRFCLYFNRCDRNGRTSLHLSPSCLLKSDKKLHFKTKKTGREFQCFGS